MIKANKVATLPITTARAGNRTIHTNGTFRVIPRRHIAVFGLEASGTTLLAEALAKATNAKETSHLLAYEGPDILVQHISLPSGFYQKKYKGERITHNVSVLVPPDCMRHPSEPDRSKPFKAQECRDEANITTTLIYHPRLFVDIVSHVRWYQDRGSQVTAILMIRDDLMHTRGKVGKHTDSIEEGQKDDAIGKELMAHAMEILSTESTLSQDVPELLIASYETLMALKGPYLLWMYRQLGILNSTHVPEFINGNEKYMAGNPLAIRHGARSDELLRKETPAMNETQAIASSRPKP